MPIPKHHELFDLVLSALADGVPRHRRDLAAYVLDRLELSEEERAQTNPGGGNRAFSRVHWAVEFLAQAGAVVRPQRGFVAITDFGRELMLESAGGVTLQRLRETPGIQAWKERTIAARDARRQTTTSDEDDLAFAETGVPPEVQIESSIRIVHAALKGELLSRVMAQPPAFLEKLVLQLLHKMGYGATPDALEHLGGSGDAGVDGVIHQDRLGIDKIYIQAKRYRETGPIGRPAVQSFVGALSGKKATRGVFITTSRFSPDAIEYAVNLTGFTVVLIDGETLTDLMLEHGVGVVTVQTFRVQGLDENFFATDD